MIFTTFAQKNFNMLAVTGANGLVGMHLVCQLVKENFPVKALYNKSVNQDLFNYVFSQFYQISNEKLNLISWVKSDILNIFSLQEAFENCEAVFHCAALVSFNSNDKNRMFKTNIEGTENVVNVCLGLKIKHLIYCSSTAALGKVKSTEKVSEKSIWSAEDKPTPYSESKHFAEMEVWRAEQEGLNVSVINPGIILGFGNWNQGSAKIFKNIYNKQLFYTKGINGFIMVEDVAKILIHFFKNKIAGERFVLVSENKSFKEVFELIANCFNKKAPNLEFKLIYLKIARPFLFLINLIYPKFGITYQTATKALNNTEFDNSKITSILPFEMTKLDVGIKKTCEFYMQYLNTKYK